MLKEGEIILCHGTSTKDIEKVLDKGYPAVRGNSKYDEVILIMSKYIRPEILTPDFFEGYKNAMMHVFFPTGNPVYRIRQFEEGKRGIFAVWSEYIFKGLRQNAYSNRASLISLSVESEQKSYLCIQRCQI